MYISYTAEDTEVLIRGFRYM